MLDAATARASNAEAAAAQATERAETAVAQAEAREEELEKRIMAEMHKYIRETELPECVQSLILSYKQEFDRVLKFQTFYAQVMSGLLF